MTPIENSTAWSSPPAWPAAAAAATPSKPNSAASASPRRTAARTTRPPAAKVERFHQTLKNWLRAQPHQPATVAELKALCNTFVELYNHQRPHRSLPGRITPAAAYQLRPKAHPGDRTNDTHWRVHHDQVDKTGRVTLRHDGRLHHIGLGHEHARTRVVMLIADRHLRVIDAATGKLLRDLILDPTRDYQPLGRRPGPQPRKPQRPQPN